MNVFRKINRNLIKIIKIDFKETHLTIGEMQCLYKVLIDYFIKAINNKQRFEEVSKHGDMERCNWNKT